MSDVDADKVYDHHTAFDIKPTEILLNVNINANQKTIRNIALDKYIDSSWNGEGNYSFHKKQFV